MNRNLQSLPYLSGVDFSSETVEAHMAKARRLHDEAIVAFIQGGTSRVAHAIGKFVSVCLNLSEHGSQARFEFVPPQQRGAKTSAGFSPDRLSPVATKQEADSGFSSGKSQEKRPGWHLAPKLKNHHGVGDMGGQYV